MHERERDNQIPSGITPEGDELFKDLFGISFTQAQYLATWEGEIGEYFRGLFNYIKNYKEEYDTNRQESESSRETQ